jgi:predicted porin
LKFFLSQKLVIAMEIFYDLASEDAAFPGEEGSGSSNDSGLRLGLRHYF